MARGRPRVRDDLQRRRMDRAPRSERRTADSSTGSRRHRRARAHSARASARPRTSIAARAEHRRRTAPATRTRSTFTQRGAGPANVGALVRRSSRRLRAKLVRSRHGS